MSGSLQIGGSQPRPLVSFVIPTYNVAFPSLDDCIESLLHAGLQQSEREIIVVDDGSRDIESLKKMLATYGDSIVLAEHDHMGVSAARNTGMQIATGEYVEFVDADDQLDASLFKTELLPLLRKHRPDVLTFRHQVPSTKYQVQRSDEYETGTQYMLENNVHGACWNYVVRCDVAQQVLFPLGVKFTEDERWTAQMLLRAGKTVATDVPAYIYRKNAASATGNKAKEATVQKIADAFATIAYLDHICGTLSGREQDALRRRVSQLTMDFVWNVWQWTHSLATLRRQICLLRERRLFPLPYKRYSRKYAFFSALTRIWIL
ncbi:MAG: glycosyltransferase [Bacteroidaceae bacterium]|nr:glycosyltransferase [Bacteroidaceae bacterium]